MGQNGNGLKTDKNGNRTEIKRERSGVTRPVVRMGDGNFFFMPTLFISFLSLFSCLVVVFCACDCSCDRLSSLLGLERVGRV